MTLKTRKLLSLLVLVVGLPVYIAAALWVVNLFDRPHFLLEIVIYVALGVVWALPFKGLFRGIGRPDPDRADP